MQKKVKGYIIHRSVYKETNLIVSLLTHDGIVSFKAQGALKVPYKLSSLVQLYTYGEYVLAFSKEGNKNTLIDGQVIKNVPVLAEDFESSIILSFLAESIVKDESFKKPYEVFDFVFNNLDKKEYYPSMIAVILKLHLLYNGSFLNSDECVKCGTKTNIATVSFNDGGYVCSKCNQIYSLPIKTVDYMKSYRYIMKANIENSTSFILTDLTKKEILNDLFSFIEENTGLKFNSKQLIIDIL